MKIINDFRTFRSGNLEAFPGARRIHDRVHAELMNECINATPVGGPVKRTWRERFLSWPWRPWVTHNRLWERGAWGTARAHS